MYFDTQSRDFVPAVIGKAEKVQKIKERIDTTLFEAANAASIEEGLEREYLVWLQILYEIDAAAALNYPVWEIALTYYKEELERL